MAKTQTSGILIPDTYQRQHTLKKMLKAFGLQQYLRVIIEIKNERNFLS